MIGDGGHPDVRNLLTDQIHVASASIWAHAATGHSVSMLAAEVVQFAVRSMWDEDAASFRDRVETEDPLVPFELNCHAACVLDRLSVLTGDLAHQDRARVILQSLAAEYREQDIFGAPYALAVVRSSIVNRRLASSSVRSIGNWGRLGISGLGISGQGSTVTGVSRETGLVPPPRSRASTRST